MERLKNSRTFLRLFNALDSRPASKVNYFIEQTDREGVLRFSGGCHDVFCGIGHTIVSPFGGRGRTMVAEETLSESVVVHELVHALGGYAREVGDETGVPLRCETHSGWSAECSAVVGQIRAEMEAWRKEQREEEEEGG